MTIKLLGAWGDQPAGTLYTTDASSEAAMIAAKVATSDLTGGIAYVPAGGVTNPNSASVGVPNYDWHRRMEARRAGITRILANGLARKVYGDGSIVKKAPAEMLWSDEVGDFIPVGGKLELMKFAGGIDIPEPGPFPLGTRIKSINTSTGVIEMTQSALYTSLDAGATNGLRLSFGQELPPFGSVAVTNTSGSAVCTGLASTTLLRKGMKVTGQYIPSNTFIASVDSSTQITLSNVTTNNATAIYVQGVAGTGVTTNYLTAGTTEGSAFTQTDGTSTLAAWVIANPSILTVGMTVSGGDQSYNYAQDLLVMPIPAGLMQRHSKLRLDWTVQDIYTGGSTTYQNGSLYMQAVLRRAAERGMPKGTGGSTNGYGRQMRDTIINSGRYYDATQAIGAKVQRNGYIEIAALDSALVCRMDGETGAAVPAARSISYMSALDGAGNADLGCDCELVLRPYWSSLSYRHMHGTISDVALTLIA